MLRPAILAISCAVLLAACVVGPTYTPPTSPAETRFRNTPPSPSIEPDTRRVTASGWWSAFGDAELERLVAEALAQNLDLAQAQARVTQAAAQARAARAGLLPAGQLGAQATRVRLSRESQFGQIEEAFSSDRDQSLYDLNGSVSWEVDLFGGLRRTSQAARATYEASLSARAGARLTIAVEAAGAYVQVRALQARLKSVTRLEDHERQVIDLTAQLASRGVIARRELDDVRATAGPITSGRLLLGAALEAETLRLEVLVGQMPGSLRTRLGDGGPLPAPPPLDTFGGPAALVRRRPDVIAAERLLAASNARIGAVMSDYYPKVSLTGLIGLESASASTLFQGGAIQPLGVAGLRWRLFDFGRVDAEVAAARGAQAEALASYRKSVLQAAADVEAALAALSAREAQVRVLSAAEGSLEQSSRSVAAAHSRGDASLRDVLETEIRTDEAQDQQLQAQAEAVMAAIRAYAALGGDPSASSTPHGR